MSRVVYNIPENAKEEVLQAMRIEKNTVVKERLLVSTKLTPYKNII